MGDGQFPTELEELFASSNVIIFTCGTTGDFPISYISDNSKNLLGFESSYFVENSDSWSGRIHPEDRERILQQFQEVVSKGKKAFDEFRFKTKEGAYIWLRTEMKLVVNSEGNKSVVHGYAVDITSHKKTARALKENKKKHRREIEGCKEMEDKLQERLSYEKALSKCSNLLLESNSEEALQKSLQILLDVSESDRVYLYKNVEENGELYLELVMEATANGTEAGEEYPVEKTKYAEVPWWHKKLSEQEVIQARIDEVPEPERSIMEQEQVKSVLAIPISVNQEWYGYVGFSDKHEKRSWQDSEIELLNTAAGIIASFEKRRNIEKTLVQQRNYTDTILNSLPSIYLLMDEEFRIVQWNKNAELNTGYRSGELKDKNAFDLIAPEDHEALRDAICRVKRAEGEGAELTLLTKSGEKAPYYWRGYFITLDDQKYLLCVGLDITQHKETEKELLDEKRFNEALIESLPGMFYMIDSHGKYHRWNQNLEDELGYSSGELRDMGPVDVFDEEEFKRVDREIQRVYEEGQSEIEAEVMRKDGTKIPYFFTGKLFARDDEQYLVGVGYDISEQRKAREELKKNEELFRNLFINAPAAIVMVNPENKIQNVNKSFQELFGYTEEELLGKDIDEVLVPEDEYKDAPKMPRKKAMENFHKEAKRLTKSGELVDVFVAAIPVYVNDEPLAGFGMYIDITDQKNYEKKIYSSLKEKQVLLKEIHHRVKNNLAVISGLIQLQIYETDEPTIRETLKESESRIQTMALIHEKLYRSQNLSRIYCDTYTNDLVETIRSTISSEKEISVITEIEDVTLNITQAVPFALLINEMVTNSFKHAFTDSKKGKIKIELREKDDYLEVRISDNGKGLPEGVSLEGGGSLGMTLIHKFLEQLDADWNLTTNDGTFLTLSFERADTNGSSGSPLLDF